MSTLSIPRPRVSSDTDVPGRFDAPARSAVSPAQPVPGQRRPAERRAPAPDEQEFATVFDLDYGHRTLEATRIRRSLPERRADRARIRRVAPTASPTSPTSPTSPAVPAGPVRLTRRGRAVLVLAFLGLALALMIPLGGWATASLSAGSPDPVRVVVVQPGDTLYGIAGDLAEPGEVRAMVHRIQQLNSLPGGQIAVGQQLAVPVG